MKYQDTRNRFGTAIKEKIACVIGQYFSTNQIVNIFAGANIQVNTSLFAKWRITLDGFNKMTEPQESIPHILISFCHPLNFETNPEVKEDFIKDINNILAYDYLQIVFNERTAWLASTNDTPLFYETEEAKTSTDYILEALNFFKNEYNKVRMAGLKYEYSLGENINSQQTDQNEDDYDARLKAIERLTEAGFITEYTVESRVENSGYYLWDYAICKIDETKITQPEAPRASEQKVQELIHKIQIVGGKMEIDGLQDGLKAIAQSKKEADKPKFPYKLPAGTKWEEITIKFKDDENVYIQVKHFKHTASYKELGLVGRGKNPNPSELWNFLKVLAQVNGELAIKDTQARDKYKKQKELLAKALQSYFSIDYDPFYPYRSSSEKQGNSYKIKITLIPLQNTDKKVEAAEEDDDLGVKEYLKEQAPQVNEE